MIHNARDPGAISEPIRPTDSAHGGLHIEEGDIINVTMPDESVVTFVAIKHNRRLEGYTCDKCDGSSHACIFDKYCLADRIGFLCYGYRFKLVDNLLEDL